MDQLEVTLLVKVRMPDADARRMVAMQPGFLDDNYRQHAARMLAHSVTVGAAQNVNSDVEVSVESFIKERGEL